MNTQLIPSESSQMLCSCRVPEGCKRIETEPHSQCSTVHIIHKVIKSVNSNPFQNVQHWALRTQFVLWAWLWGFPVSLTVKIFPGDASLPYFATYNRRIWFWDSDLSNLLSRSSSLFV